MIEIEKLNKIYKSDKSSNTYALNDISLKFDGRELTFIVGPSGSGKSSLLNLLGALDTATSGKIICDGYDITSMNSKELEKYRNSYVGFIFQDYNLLEEYNVYDNILLSLELQDKKDDSKIKNIMESLNISSLSNRKINELSGGQKQRVAIARALVKDSKLILADEPTGNLDSKTSIEIIKILKDISKTCEVIVVTHDVKLAESYGDRIITISDGKVIKDNYKSKKKVINDSELVSSKLSLKNTLKMALASMKNNLFRTIMTTLLGSVIIAFLIVLSNLFLTKKDVIEVYNSNINNINEYDISITKCNPKIYAECYNSYMTEDDIKNIEEKTNMKSNLIYRLYDNDKQLGFTLGELKVYEKNYYYFNREFLIVDVKDDELYSNIIYGTKPKNYNEVVISEYLSEVFMKYGVYREDDTLYKPTSKETLISDKVKLKFGNNSVIVVGILGEHSDVFDDIKSDGVFPTKYINNFNYQMLSQDHLEKRKEYIYTSSFIDNVTLKNTNKLPYAQVYFDHHEKLDNKSIKFTPITKEVNYYNKDGRVTTDSLKNNEIIISLSLFQKIYAGYVGNFMNDFYDYAYENRQLSYTDAYDQFLIEAFKSMEHHINSGLKLKYNNDAIVNEDIKIIGVTLDDVSYVASNFLEEYYDNSRVVMGVRLNANKDADKEKILNSFSNSKTLNLGDSNYTIEYDYQDIFAGLYNTVHGFRMYIAILIGIVILFLYFFFTNFINNSIKSNKKRIGAFMMLGVSKKNIKSILLCELIVILVMAFGLSIALSFIGQYLINFSATAKVFVDAAYIIPNTLTYLSILFGLIIIAIMILIGSISTIVKMQPIDAYNEK